MSAQRVFQRIIFPGWGGASKKTARAMWGLLADPSGTFFWEAPLAAQCAISLLVFLRFRLPRSALLLKGFGAKPPQKVKNVDARLAAKQGMPKRPPHVPTHAGVYLGGGGPKNGPRVPPKKGAVGAARAV